MATTESAKDGKKAQREDLDAQLAATRRDVEILASMLRERASAGVYEARDAAVGRAQELSADARALIDCAEAEAYRLTGEAGDHIRRNPLAAIGIAFGLGWLIGMLNRK